MLCIQYYIASKIFFEISRKIQDFSKIIQKVYNITIIYLHTISINCISTNLYFEYFVYKIALTITFSGSRIVTIKETNRSIILKEWLLWRNAGSCVRGRRIRRMNEKTLIAERGKNFRLSPGGRQKGEFRKQKKT